MKTPKSARSAPSSGERRSRREGGPRKWAPLGLLTVALALAAMAFPRTGTAAEEGAKRLDTFIQANSEMAPGSRASVRVVTTRPLSLTESEPVQADVEIALEGEKAERRVLWKGKTDVSGTLSASFSVPEIPEGEYTLVVKTGWRGEEEKQTSQVRLRTEDKILLTTDKPLYQPAQTIHIRALALRRQDLKPIAGEEIVFEVEDSKGNKVAKEKGKLSDFGIASTDFLLANEVNLGTYRVRAILGRTQEEKTVNVDRYVLPKFDVRVETEKPFYTPGASLKGRVASAYFFGKKVEGGDVTLKFSTFDVAFNEFASLNGKTDKDGVYSFEVNLPDKLVGQPLEQGKGIVKIDVEVKDKAEHTEKKTVTRPVAAADLAVELVPESGHLVSNLENVVYAIVARPSGEPVEGASVKVTQGQGTGGASGETDASGIAVVKLTPDSKLVTSQWEPTTAKQVRTLALTVEAKGPKGESVRGTKMIPADEGDAQTLILRTDKAIYKGGETASLEVISTAKKGWVFVDVVRGGQTALTKSIEVDGGRGAFKLDLSPDLFGSIEMHAYRILPSGDIVRDTRVVYVEPPSDLRIEASLDEETYRPGAEAKIRFHVTDAAGGGKAAALGLVVVDESVYALQEMQPGLEKVYFTLEKELMKPRFEIHLPEGIDDLVKLPIAPIRGGEEGGGPRILDESKQRVAKVLLAGAEPVEKAKWVLNPQAKRAEEVRAKAGQIVSALLYQSEAVGALGRWDDGTKKWAWKERIVQEVARAASLGTEVTNGPFGEPLTIKEIVALEPALADFDEVAKSVAAQRIQRIYGALYQLGSRSLEGKVAGLFRKQGGAFQLPEDAMDQAIAKGFLTKGAIVDPWGRRIRLRKLPADKPNPEPYSQEMRLVEVRSAGPDGLFDTADDVTSPYYRGDLMNKLGGQVMLRGRGGVAFGMMAEDRAMAGMPVPAPAMPMAQAMRKEATVAAGAAGAKGGEGEAAVTRVREYFPETLLFRPALITDDAGRAELALTVADSITTWRLSAQASSRDGLLGSATHGIRVFQDFFVDLDLPVALTQNDEVAVPVAIYNYLQESQKVRLKVEPAGWFELKDEGEKSLTLEPNQVVVRYFRLRVKEIGSKTLTVMAYGTRLSDAIKKDVRIVPDGKEIEQVVNAPLGGEATYPLEIPVGAIPGAGTLLVKVYPGLFSQVVEGLDGILRMPGGCFEQTSSTTYPNVLVLDYLQRTAQATPELQMKARGFIQQGYQRLLTFEVPGGGFSWFGQAPAHKALTAYGLMEFADMSKVHEVDERVLERTRAWLAGQQEKDGSYTPTQGLDEVGQKFGQGVLKNTAYIAWAILETGQRDETTKKSVEYLKAHVGEVKDAYTLALILNALVLDDPKGKETKDLLAQVYDARTDDAQAKTTYWQPADETQFSRGKAATVETTALVLQAFLRAGMYLPTVSRGLAFLTQSKDSYGTWGSTQATVLALRTLVKAGGKESREVRADVTVKMDDEERTVKITPETSDVLQMLDFGPKAAGKHTVRLAAPEGTGLMVQVASRYYLPWNLVREAQGAGAPPPAIEIGVVYDRTQLKMNDIVKETATILYKGDRKTAMVVIDLGIPPGFQVMSEDLDALKEKKVIEKWSMTGRQVILYVSSLAPGQKLEVGYRMKAKFPIEAKSPRSEVYEYYRPEARAEAAPVVLKVQ